MNKEAAEIFTKYISTGDKFRLKLLGDSITQGCGGTDFLQNGEPFIEGFARNPDGFCWANLLKKHMESRYNCEVVNNGCAGTKIEFILDNYETLVDENDDIILCMIGTNNRTQYFTEGPKKDGEEALREFLENILKLHDRLAADGKNVIYMASVPATPAKEADTDRLWRIFHMNDVNEAYRIAHKKCGFPFISLYELFSAYVSDSKIDLESLMYDGLHPNDDGYRVMFDIIVSELGL